MIPNKVKFLGHEYGVMQVPANDLEGGNGEAWLKKCQIKIDRDLPESRKEAVLIHEILELIDAHFELELPHQKIETLEECLYVILKETGLLVFPVDGGKL